RQIFITRFPSIVYYYKDKTNRIMLAHAIEAEGISEAILYRKPVTRSAGKFPLPKILSIDLEGCFLENILENMLLNHDLILKKISIGFLHQIIEKLQAKYQNYFLYKQKQQQFTKNGGQTSRYLFHLVS
ncbi:MAG: hypothetical protein WCG42_01590, partial [Parachlamydiaceae bacterium]